MILLYYILFSLLFGFKTKNIPIRSWNDNLLYVMLRHSIRKFRVMSMVRFYEFFSHMFGLLELKTTIIRIRYGNENLSYVSLFYPVLEFWESAWFDVTDFSAIFFHIWGIKRQTFPSGMKRKIFHI